MAEAFEPDLEKELHQSLIQSRDIINRAENKLKDSLPVDEEITKIKEVSESIKITHALLQERFRLRQEDVNSLGAKARERHRVMEEGYLKALGEYLNLIESLQQNSSQQSALGNQLKTLKTLLDNILPRTKRPIFGNLPYKHLNYPAREPDVSPAIIPSYRGGNQAAFPDDTKSTTEAPLSPEIAALAQSLNWNPASIYEYVKNSIDTEWYWGCMKGAEETLRQNSGNDCDQATLLSAMLRASGFPTRYVRGTIEFFPDIEKAKNLTGIDDPLKIAEFFQKAGIPYKPVIAGGRIANIQIEHIWVESLIPYANYRGAIIDEHGKTWLGLDTSIKPKGYTYNTPLELSANSAQLLAIRDEYLGAIQTETPLEYFKEKISAITGQLADSFKLTRSLIPESMKILPASMQFDQKKITHEYTEIPDELKHKVRFIASHPQSPTANALFDIRLDTLNLSNQKLSITYEPETVEDQQIIDTYGGLDNTPAYLVRLRPVLKVNEERVVAGRDGLPMGADYELTIELISPNGIERTTNTHITGNLTAIGIVAQRAISSELSAISEADEAETILFKEANRYIDRWNQAENELASLLHLSIARPIPTVTAIGGVIDITYLLDSPHGFKWKGVYVDAALRAASPVTRNALHVEGERQKTFMTLSALQGSVLEHKVLEDDWKVEFISTAKMMQIVDIMQPAPEIITVDKTNLNDILPDLPFDDGIKDDISNAVNQNQTVRIPTQEIAYKDWTGIGYIKENPVTGEAGYMLSGMIAGSENAESPEKWANQYLTQILKGQYAGQFNKDPLAAAKIIKIPVTDGREGTVGQPLAEPLAVLVMDAKGVPVMGAKVKFTVLAGGGNFGTDAAGQQIFLSEATTGKNGIAKSKAFILGKKTSDNPTYYWKDGHYHQVGLNEIDASLDTGISTSVPFIEYGLPGDLHHITRIHDSIYNEILSFAGFVALRIEDEFNNPISNQPVNFTIHDGKQPSNLPCTMPQSANKAYLIDMNEACLINMPRWGECGDTNAQTRQIISNHKGGAAVSVILGGIPYADYEITAKTGSLTETFHAYTTKWCGETNLYIDSAYISDYAGHIINAGKTGSQVPVRAKLYYLKNDGTNYVRTDFTASKVTFSGQEGVSKGNGLFEGTYTLGNSGINWMNASGTATIDGVVKTAGIQIPFYGVDITVDSQPVIIVDSNGLSADYYDIAYTIKPAEYQASSAYMFIYKENDPNPWWFMANALQGTGTATIDKGFPFDIDSNYELEVVLNYGTGVELRSGRMPLSLLPESIMTNPFSLTREYRLSEFDTPLNLNLADYTDTYQVFTMELTTASEVSVKVLDDGAREKAVIIPKTVLLPGEYKFVVDYRTISDAGISVFSNPAFNILLESKATDGTQPRKVLYPGKIGQRTYGKMLGQTMVHDVLIQDGSLNLTRQDIALKGRGPQLSFSRSYNNQSSGRGHKPLGEGWRHSLDMRLIAISSAESGMNPVPAWVDQYRNRFFKPADISQRAETWNMVVVNGTTFRKSDGRWYPEKARHGSLEDVGGSFVYTSKDGTRYYYDYPWLKESHVKSIADRNGNVMIFTYDDFGKLIEVSDAVNRKLSFAYENAPLVLGVDATRLIKVTGPEGIVIDFTYNDKGYLESVTRAERVETYAYQPEPGFVNADHNLVKTTDSNGNSFSYVYYGMNEISPSLANFVKVLKSQDVVKEVRYPDSYSARFQYDVQTDNKRIVADLRGNNTTYILNYYGNPKRIEEPGGRTTFMTWSIDEGLIDNLMTSRTDGRGNTIRYEYDTHGNIRLETDPYGKTITTTWNPKFNLPELRTDRNGITQRWYYDPVNGNLLVHEDGDGKRTTYTYHPTGELWTMTDPLLNTTTYTYDQWGNPDTVTAPEGSITDRAHDIRGRLQSVKDPNGNITSYTYDRLDYPDKIIHPAVTAYTMPLDSTNVQDYDFDPEGNLFREVDRVGLEWTYTYTPRKQVKTITRNVGGVKTFDYDPNGNLISETDWKGLPTIHTYDALNQRETTTNRLGHTMRMTYDLSGNPKSVTDYDGRTTDYEYDKLNRLTDTWQPAMGGLSRGNIHYTYYNEADPKTNLKTETDQEGNTTTYEYNGRYLRTKRTNALAHVYRWEYDDSGNLRKETDEESKYVEHGYDRQNRKTSTLRMGGILTEYKYDLNGNRTHVIDPLLRDTETRYDAWNRPYLIIDPEQYSRMTQYDGEGKEVRKVDGNGYASTWRRDPRGLVLEYRDAENNPTTYSYDLNGNIETVTDARSFVTKNIYDSEDRLRSITEAVGTPEERTKEIVLRDKMGNPLQTKDYNGNISVVEYNEINLPSKVYDPAPFNANYQEKTYYRTGKVKNERNRRGHTTTHEYDALNREIKATDAKNQTTRTTYDRVGNIKTVKDKRDIVTENFYDDLHRLVRIERAGLRIKSNEYDDAGNIRFVTDANNHRTEHIYYPNNLLDTTIFPDGTIEKKTYDGAGNLKTLINEEGRVTTYTYDKENRQTSIEFAGEKTQKTYDPVGNLKSVIRPKLNSRTMEYDGLRRLTKVTDSPFTVGNPSDLNLATQYKYDPNGNLRHQYDPKGNHVEFTYDSLNRKTKHIQHKASGNLVTNYTLYDPESNLKEMVDPKGQKFTYDYDELNRQTDTYYPDVTSPFNRPVRNHTEYDPNNNVTLITETKVGPNNAAITDTTVNHYDNFDRLDDSTQRGVLIDYTYDNNGNRTMVSTQSGSTVYTFDSRNRLKTAVSDGLTSTYTYYPDGKKKQITYPNGTEVDYTYYDTNRVKDVINKATSSGSIISSYSYGYDLNGNRTSQTELQNGATETTAYTYDSADRMKDFTVTGASVTKTEYTFDGYNRKTERVTEYGSVVKNVTSSYDETNWLTSLNDSAGGQVITYTYDNNGNTIHKADSLLPNDDTTFTYDSRNQLIEVKRGPPGSETVLGQYDYNFEGLRVRHRLSERGDVDYYYDDDAVIEERNTTGNSLLAHYSYGDRLISMGTANDIQYYHYDALGSTVNLTTTSGGTQTSYQLNPWGHIRKQYGLSLNRHIFTGQEHDYNTGLIYFGARYYDPDTARFITQDSYLGEPGTPPSLHRYLYAYSNPTMYVDLMGYEAEEAQGNNAENSQKDSWYVRAGRWLLGEEVAKKAVELLGATTAEDPSGEKSNLNKLSDEDLSRFAGGGLNMQSVKEWRRETEPDAREAVEKIKTGSELITGVDFKDLQDIRENPNAENIGKVGGLLIIGKTKWLEKAGVLFKGEKAEKALEWAGKLLNKLRGKKVEKAAEERVEIAREVERGINVYSARTSPQVAQSVLDKIDPSRFNPKTRFGRALYVAEEGETAVAEIAHHGGTATHVIRYELNFKEARILDLTNPAIASRWSYAGGNNYTATQAIATKAKAAGFNTIKYDSLRAKGSNYAVLSDYDKLLQPVMVSPVP